MPVTGPIPLPGLGSDVYKDVMDYFETIQRRKAEQIQAQQRLKQEALANEQLNKYRMGQLDIDRLKAQSEANIAPMRYDLLKAQIDEANARAKALAQGGGYGRSAGTSDELRYHATVSDYNPDLTPDQLREASDVYAKGGTELSDGTKLAPMNPTLERALNRAYKSTTSAALITQAVRAGAAEAEMPAVDKAIEEGRSPYGKTIFGFSPQQIKDTWDVNNKDAQKRLGNYIASDLLAFDKAALQTRIAGTESGVTIINEIMDKSKQTINAKYPMLSDEARQIALEKVGDTLRKMLKARQKYGIGAAKASGYGQKEEDKSEENVNTRELPTGSIPKGAEKAVFDPQGNFAGYYTAKDAERLINDHPGYSMKNIS